MLIKACLNGSLRPVEHDALPLSPAALANDAAACRDAGAGAVHIHPRGFGGRETLDADACGAAIEAVRDQCPGLPVGLTTGLWICGKSSRRLALIEAWTVLPDFCSVNFSEPGTDELCRLLIQKGIAIEAGLTSLADVRSFLESGFVDQCLRVLIEVDAPPKDAIKEAEAINKMLDRAEMSLPRVQHGMGATAWLLLEDALSHGYDIRIGLEDVLTLPDGTIAGGNADLVAVAARLASRVMSHR